MNEEFVNVYIELMSKKLEDYAKNDLMLATRFTLAERLIKALQQENENLLKENARLQAILNKKATKSKDEF